MPSASSQKANIKTGFETDSYKNPEKNFFFKRWHMMEPFSIANNKETTSELDQEDAFNNKVLDILILNADRLKFDI